MRVAVHLEGVTPLLINSDRTVDKLDPLTKEKDRIAAITKKTDEVIWDLYRAEFMATIRWSPESGVHILGVQVWKSIVEAARLSKKGKSIERGVMVLPESMETPIDYQGPRTPEELWDDGRFRYSTSVGQMGKRVMRTRPRFTTWACTTYMEVFPDIINVKELAGYADIAGRLIGVGDGRTLGHGRYNATVTPA